MSKTSQPIIGIYKLTSPSGKCYIGQSRNIKQRFGSYKKLACKKQNLLFSAITKYSWDNFLVEILEECSEEKLNELEIFYIKKYNSLAPNGYNLKEGGNSKKATEISRLNMRRSKMRKWKDYLETYDEPLLMFDKNYKLINKFNNLEDAAIFTNIPIVDIYYGSYANLPVSEFIWILCNSRLIENLFGNVECSVYEVYKTHYPEEFLNQI